MIIGIVLFVVSVVTAVFGFYQEFSANEAMASFKNYIPAKCKVIRDGKEMEVLTEDIVVGDIVVITMGMRVPADMRVIECSNLYVDHSCLTGESMELERLTDHVEDKPLEAKNLMFYGTLVKSGAGKAVALKVGDRTFMGLIAKVMTDTEVTETTLGIELKHFIHIIAMLATGYGVTFFIIGIILKLPWIYNFIFMIGIIVANVPEGLLATITVGLALTAKKMADKNVLVKKLECVETLGSTSCICSDKTGTLTQNKMTVVSCYIYDKIFGVQNKLNTQAYSLTDNSYEQNDAFKKLIKIGSLCSTANLENIKIVEKKEIELKGKYVDINCNWNDYRLLKCLGSATESGIIKFVYP